MFQVCSLQTLLDCHTSGPDLSALGILNISHPTLMAPPVSDEMHAQIIIWHDEQHLSVPRGPLDLNAELGV